MNEIGYFEKRFIREKKRLKILGLILHKTKLFNISFQYLTRVYSETVNNESHDSMILVFLICFDNNNSKLFNKLFAVIKTV
jgi:hypothetical protein